MFYYIIHRVITLLLVLIISFTTVSATEINSHTLTDNQLSATMGIITNFLLSSESLVLGSTYYVSLQGNDTNIGSKNSPWRHVKYAISQLVKGDTLLIREGTYIETDIFIESTGTKLSPISIKSYPNEEVILSGNNVNNTASQWKKIGENIYEYTKLGKHRNIRNVSLDDVPLKLMVRYNNFNGDITDLSAPGQWSRNSENNKVWVWLNTPKSPAELNLEISSLYTFISIPKDFNYITIDGLTIEGGYYPLFIEGDHINIKNSTIKNSFADAIKVSGWANSGEEWNSKYGLIENCDIYNFGENGIDITGGDYWRINNVDIHDGISNRYPGMTHGNKINGIILKNNNIGTIVENSTIRDMTATYGAISIGGDSYYDDVPPAKNIIIRNNVIRNITGSFIVAFYGSENSLFTNNILYKNIITSLNNSSEPYSLLLMRNGYSHNQILFNSKNNTVTHNIFNKNIYRDTENKYLYSEYKPATAENTTIDNNRIDSQLNTYWNGNILTYEEAQAIEGFDVHSSNEDPIFRDEAHYDFYLLN